MTMMTMIVCMLFVKNSCSRHYVFSYVCVVLYLYIFIALLAVHTNQKRMYVCHQSLCRQFDRHSQHPSRASTTSLSSSSFIPPVSPPSTFSSAVLSFSSNLRTPTSPLSPDRPPSSRICM